MKFGIWTFCTEYSIQAADMARAVEERGFDSLFLPEHTHIPANRATPYPGGGELPKEYAHTIDPFVGLAAAAMVTRTLMLGTGVSLVVERDPILLAKSVASLDQLSGGRVLLGIGGGWNREELENHGQDWNRRFKLMRERTEAMITIWDEEEASYHGEFVNFDNIWSWPKPVQKPHPPIIIGGYSEHTLKRVARYGDEWMPTVTQGLGSFAERIAELKDLAAQAGREHITVGVYRSPEDPAELARFREIGVSRAVFLVHPGTAGTVLPKLDQLAEVVRSVS